MKSLKQKRETRTPEFKDSLCNDAHDDQTCTSHNNDVDGAEPCQQQEQKSSEDTDGSKIENYCKAQEISLVTQDNFCYDFLSRGSNIHGVINDGEDVKYYCHKPKCHCFFIHKCAMKPKSGIYTIKIKIDNVNNNTYLNSIGITSQTLCSTLGKHLIDRSEKKGDFDKFATEKYGMQKRPWKKEFDWRRESLYYIGWSASDEENLTSDEYLPHGLYCGYGKKGRECNIFRQNDFEYVSKNDNYKSRLPGWDRGDTIFLSYNSNDYTLSFGKLNDNKLDSLIKHLPQNQTYYCFVGHWFGKMSLTMSIVSDAR